MAYKILSLDGGGSWAMIQARVLMDLYGDIHGHELLKNFDMAIANSGGSLVLASLCNNMLLSEIAKVFLNEQERKQVFSKLTLVERLKNGFAEFEELTHVGPKYSTERKLTGLVGLLKAKEVSVEEQPEGTAIVDLYLEQISPLIKDDFQILIVGFDYFRQRANFFRSNTNSHTNKFNDGKFFSVTLGHAIHASSNAPVNYFENPATISVNNRADNDKRTTWFWDGAVSGFNNPVLAGLIEAITNQCAENLADYRVLSIGTGTGDRAIIADYADSTNQQTRDIYNANIGNPLAVTDHSFSFLNDVRKISGSILMDPPDTDTFIAYSILHPGLANGGNIVRINPCLMPVMGSDLVYEYPEVYQNEKESFIALLDLDMDAIENDQVELIKGFCDKFIVENEPCVPNQLIRGDISGNYLGFPTYKQAKDHWGNIGKD